MSTLLSCVVWDWIFFIFFLHPIGFLKSGISIKFGKLHRYFIIYLLIDLILLNKWIYKVWEKKVLVDIYIFPSFAVYRTNAVQQKASCFCVECIVSQLSFLSLFHILYFSLHVISVFLPTLVQTQIFCSSGLLKIFLFRISRRLILSHDWLVYFSLHIFFYSFAFINLITFNDLDVICTPDTHVSR